MYGQRMPPRRKKGFGRVFFVLAVLSFSGWYIYTTLVPSGPRTAVVSSGSLGFHYSGDAMIIRNETAYDEDGVSSIQYIAEEGSKVFKSDLICMVYTSGYSQKEVNTLQNLRDQIKDYHRSLIAKEATYDQRMTSLENDVVLKAKDVRKMVQGAKGNMLNMEKVLNASITARQDYIRGKYREDTRLSRLYDDESTQLKRIQSYTKQRNATQESLVSFYTDGYEELNTSNFEQFSPAQVKAMLNGQKPEKSAVERGRTPIYRLVRQNGWGVLLLLNNTDWTPAQGQAYQLKLEQFENTVVNATVMSFTRSGGELLLRLSIPTDVSPVLFMRTCQAEIGENVSSMKVPTKCIVRNKNTETGAVTTGVVVIEGGNQSFVPVTIISADNSNTFIEPVPPAYLYEGQTVRVY